MKYQRLFLSVVDRRAGRGFGRSSAQILHGPGGGFAEGGGGVERPVGVAQKFTSDDDEVGLAGADDVRGLSGVGDHADGAGEDAGLGTDGFSEGRLIAGAKGNGRAEDVAAGGAVDEVDAAVAEERGEADGLGEVPAAFGVVSRRRCERRAGARGTRLRGRRR